MHIIPNPTQSASLRGVLNQEQRRQQRPDAMAMAPGRRRQRLRPRSPRSAENPLPKLFSAQEAARATSGSDPRGRRRRRHCHRCCAKNPDPSVAEDDVEKAGETIRQALFRHDLPPSVWTETRIPELPISVGRSLAVQLTLTRDGHIHLFVPNELDRQSRKQLTTLILDTMQDRCCYHRRLSVHQGRHVDTTEVPNTWVL